MLMFLFIVIAGTTLQVRPNNQPMHPKMQIPYHTTKTQPFRPPHFADQKTKTLTYGMLRAESRLAPCQIKIQGEGGDVSIDWNRGSLRQDTAAGSWSYVKGILTVKGKSGFYRGAANRSDVLDYLAALTGGADTFARQLLFRQKPFSDFFSADETARVVGSEVLKNGTPTYILSVSGKAIRGSINIRKKDLLVVAADAVTLAPSGADAYHAQRTYAYLPFPGETVFRLRGKPNGKIKPLPKSAIKIGKHLIR
jgi:hypothetical protein